MDISTIIVVVSMLAVAIATVGLLYNNYQLTKANKARFDTAIPASAKIIRIGDSDYSRRYKQNFVDLVLEITPPNGAPYHHKMTYTVDPQLTDRLQVGSNLAIRIDAQNPKKIYSAESGMQLY